MARSFVGMGLFAFLLTLTGVVFGQAAQEQQAAVLAVTTNEALGDILTDGDGNVLYMFTADMGEGSACTGECAEAWPPVLTEGEPVADKGVNTQLLGTVEREDGSLQATYNGMPLYRFVRDQGPGDVTGQDVEGFGGEWYVVSVEGEPVEEAEQAAAEPEGDVAGGGAAEQAEPAEPAPAEEPAPEEPAEPAPEEPAEPAPAEPAEPAPEEPAPEGADDAGGEAAADEEAAAEDEAAAQEDQPAEQDVAGGGQAGHAEGGPAEAGARFSGEYTPVTAERLMDPEPGNWLMYKRTYDLHGYSPLDQINAQNIDDLVPVWTFSTGVTDGHQAPPIVNDGIMFVTGAFNTLFALDARSGDLIWEYRRELAEDVAPEVCCGMVNRGVALFEDKLYLATLDSHLLAFDALTGEIIWDQPVEDYLSGYAMTNAPLVADGKVIVGVAGGEYGIRAFVVAYDVESGEQLWKTYMIPAPGDPGSETWEGDTWQTGGASIWVTGSYDPETNITYWGTGNGGPWMGEARPGDNLYISSVVGMDVETGEIVSHYQYNPNESWDYDEVSDNTLVEVERDGESIEGVIHAGRNGYFYLLDREDLSLIYGVPFIEGEPKTISGFDDNGRPIVAEERVPGIGKSAEVCPVTGGANNWFGLAFNPETDVAFVPTTEYCMTITGTEAEYRVGQTYLGADADRYPPENLDYAGAFQAIDVATGEVLWKHTQQMPVRSPAMPTAGGLVFVGDIFDREFRAFDAETGEIVWRFKTNSSVLGVPVSYEIDGTQYIAVMAGYGGAAANYIPRAADAFGVPFTPVSGGALWVFALKQ